MYEGRLLIAKIIKSLGFRGEVKAELLTDFPERFKHSFVCAVHKEENPDPRYFSDFKLEAEETSLLSGPETQNAAPALLRPKLGALPSNTSQAPKIAAVHQANAKLDASVDDAKNLSPVRFLRVKRATLMPGFVRIAFVGIDSKEEADELKACFLSLDPSEAKPLPQGRWYKRDLFGLKVFDEREGFLGTVKDILHYPASDLIVAEKEADKDLLIPFVESMVKEVLPEEGRIKVLLPDGFIEVYRS